VIRKAEAQELPALSELCVEAYQEMASKLAPPDRDKQLRVVGDVEARAREGIVLVAVDGDELAGTISYYAPKTPRSDRFEPEWALVRMLAVSRKHRRKGAARMLLEDCLARAKADAASTVALQTSELTPEAVSMYVRMGFMRVLEFPQYDRRYWVYALHLPAAAP
jgi:ribosomal protein S18 acetylase RimI-like enzyme